MFTFRRLSEFTSYEDPLNSTQIVIIQAVLC